MIGRRDLDGSQVGQAVAVKVSREWGEVAPAAWFVNRYGVGSEGPVPASAMDHDFITRRIHFDGREVSDPITIEVAQVGRIITPATHLIDSQHGSTVGTATQPEVKVDSIGVRVHLHRREVGYSISIEITHLQGVTRPVTGFREREDLRFESAVGAAEIDCGGMAVGIHLDCRDVQNSVAIEIP